MTTRSTMQSNLYTHLCARGLVQQSTHPDKIAEALSEGPITFYVGFDPTGPSLHVGHLVTLVLVRHFLNAGHRPLLLLGGGTARIGDPSGKTEMRPELGLAQIDEHVSCLRMQLDNFFSESSNRVELVDNATWLSGLGYLSFLRDIGRHFSVNRMLTADAYRERMKSGLSFIEFNYQLLQAFDFLTLLRSHTCTLQVGGDDQWSNILAGVDLCRRLEQRQVAGLTCPLLTTATGQKMGKTAQGAIWLDAKRTPVFEFFQYWVNVDDLDVVRFLKLFTFLPLAQIEEAEAHCAGSKLRILKRILAFEVTSLVHGHQMAEEAHQAASAAFHAEPLDEAILPDSRLSRVPKQGKIPEVLVPQEALDTAEEISLVELLIRCEFAKSKNEARRLMGQGGIRLGETLVTDVEYRVTRATLEAGKTILWAGKKRARKLLYRISKSSDDFIFSKAGQ